jgi:hypothetical protein
MAPPVWFDILADNPVLGEQRRASRRGEKTATNPASLGCSIGATTILT